MKTSETVDKLAEKVDALADAQKETDERLTEISIKNKTRRQTVN